MPETTSTTRRIRFSDFEVDLQSRELFKEGALVRLPNQSFLALAALLERPGELVTREELRVRLWPGNRVVEFEQGLNAIINRLREALGDSADSPRYIETLPRRGYRFVGDLAAPTPTAPAVAVATPPSLRTRIAAGCAIALLALAITAASSWMLTRAPARIAAAGATAIVTPLTTLLGQEHMPALSPDGQQVAFAWGGDSGSSAGFDLFVRALDSERLSRLTHSPALALASAWSPDGSRIVFTRMGENAGVFSMAATGGAETKLADGVFTQESLMQPAWSPDGKTVAYSAVGTGGSHLVRLMSSSGSLNRSLADAPACWHAGAPAFSPDGANLAFLCMTSVAIYSVYVAGNDGVVNAQPRELARFQGLPQGLAWRDARQILVANDSGDGGGVWTLGLDGRKTRPSIAEDALAAGLSARAGHVVYSRARQVIDIWRIAPGSNTPARKWIFSTRSQMTPQLSPDGQRIAFQSNRSGTPEIWLADADGSNAVRLTTFNGPLTGGPNWCADGRRLAFDSRETGVSAIYIVDVLERVPRRVATPQTNLALPVWSADCRWLLASDGREVLYRVPAGGGEARRLTALRSYQAAVAGDRVLFNVVEPANVSLWTQPLEGGDAAALPGMPRLAYADSWAANARSLVFTDSSTDPVTVRRYDFASHEISEIARLPNKPTPLGGLGLAISADGATVLYTHTEDLQSDLVIAPLD